MSITAMKQALEALEVAYGVSLTEDIIPKDAPIKQVILSLRDACERAEKQRPVAWATDLHFDADTEIIPANQKGKLGTDGMPVPLFSGPTAAQREWVGFTEEEINEYDYEHRDFIYDIEALLKHKNTRLG
jgi:hypothetical protein